MQFPLLFLHICGGSVGLLSGTVAISARKGGPLHRASGNIFTIAMLTLAATGLYLAILNSQPGNMIGSFITFYLIGTAWLAGSRGNKIGIIDWLALLIGLVGAAAVNTLGINTVTHPATADPSAPAGMSFFFGIVLLLAAAGDIHILVGRAISKRQRITRHLWRMCFGLFIATGSFFLGKQKIFPAFLRGSILLTVLAVLPFPLMIYWFFRVRFSKVYQPRSTPEMVTLS